MYKDIWGDPAFLDPNGLRLTARERITIELYARAYQATVESYNEKGQPKLTEGLFRNMAKSSIQAAEILIEEMNGTDHKTVEYYKSLYQSNNPPQDKPHDIAPD